MKKVKTSKANKEKTVVCIECGRKFLAQRADAKYCSACAYERRLKKKVKADGEEKSKLETAEQYIEQVPLPISKPDAAAVQVETQTKVQEPDVQPDAQRCSICDAPINRTGNGKYHYCPKCFQVVQEVLKEGSPTQYKGKPDELFEATKRKIEAKKAELSSEAQEPKKIVPDIPASVIEDASKWRKLMRTMHIIHRNSEI